MITLTRRVTFSSGHRYWRSDWSDEENRRVFGEWASRFNHGHNYVLDVAAEGAVDRETGMVVNIKLIDDLLQEQIVRRFDGKSLNDEIAFFERRAPCLENFLQHIRDLLFPEFGPPPGGKIDVRLRRLRLEEMPTFWAELDLETNMTTLTRTYEFAASHRLHVPALSAERNLELFGKCNNPSGHGHNYVLEVTVTGDVDPSTGMMLDLYALDRSVEALVVDRYDHHNLDTDIPEFAGQVTTSEVIVQAIWDALDGKLPATLHRVRLFETARSSFEIERS